MPRSVLPEVLDAVGAIGRRHDLIVSNVFHAGDGNLHPVLVTPRGDDDARARAQLAFEEIIAAALALGGTVTGEHGVGLLKRGGLARDRLRADRLGRA